MENQGGANSICFLRGWKGNEDEDVDIESSGEKSQEMVEGLSRFSESASSGMGYSHAKKGNREIVCKQMAPGSAETLSANKSKLRQRHTAKVDDLQGEGHSGTGPQLICELNICEDTFKVIEEESTASLSLDESGSKSADEESPVKSRTRSHEGKRLNAKKFRTAFNAKLTKSRKLPNKSAGQGKTHDSPETSETPLKTSFLWSKRKGRSQPEYAKTRNSKRILSLSQDCVENEVGDGNAQQGEKLAELPRKGKSQEQEETPPPPDEKSLSGRPKRHRKNNNFKDYVMWTPPTRHGPRKNHSSKKITLKDVDDSNGIVNKESEHEAYLDNVLDAPRSGNLDLSNNGINVKSTQDDADRLSDHVISFVNKDNDAPSVLESNSGCKESLILEVDDGDSGKQNKSELSLDEKRRAEIEKSLVTSRNIVVHEGSQHEKRIMGGIDAEENSGDTGKDLDSPPSNDSNEANEKMLSEDLSRDDLEQASLLHILSGESNLLAEKDTQDADHEDSAKFIAENGSILPSDLPAEDLISDQGALSHELRDDGSKPDEQDNSIDSHDNACQSCGLKGAMVDCGKQGCKVAYHAGCLDPPMKETLSGDWYCSDCVGENNPTKLNAITMVIDSIWDAKSAICEQGTLEASCNTKIDGNTTAEDPAVNVGRRRSTSEVTNESAQGDGEALSIHVEKIPVDVEKIYLVKYKNTSHIHNQWVPESQLVKEAPKILSNFKRKVELGMAPKWNSDWVQPCKIIGKKTSDRTGISDVNESCGSNDTCQWFVKWKGLGYEHCTWEPSDLPALTTSTAMGLIKDFEERCQAARKRDKEDKHESACRLRSGFQKLEVQPDWMKGGKLSPGRLDALNKICNSWKTRLNGMIVEDSSQERSVICILFLLMLFKEFESMKPMLVVAPSSSISLWEAKLSEWAVSVNVVTYIGIREARQIIQSQEIVNESGHLMVDILLTNFDTLNLDLDFLKGINWEALAIDECQRLKSTKVLRSFQSISADYILLLFSEPLKDNVDEYSQILSLLEDHSEGLEEDGRHEEMDMANLKKRLSRHIVYEKNCSTNGQFKEFWVPVDMADAQVEEYCQLLIENLSILSATRSKRADTADLSRGLLLKLRECCIHPYLVKPTLQGSLVNPTAKELLDLGIKLSGKLQFLDSLLSEVKCAGKKAVVITQMHLRSEKDRVMMNILDDYMRQQFGPNSYERADAGLTMHKKQASLQKFNARNSGCFVFLLDKRACGPTIRFHSVNIVIIFDSDWNPQSDIQALQKVHFDCLPKDLRICRLYTPWSIEERALLFARLNSEQESNFNSFSMVVCQKLLRWGVRENLRRSHSFENCNALDRIGYTQDELRILTGQNQEGLLLGRQEDSQGFLLSTAFEPRVAGRYGEGLCLYGENDATMKEDQELPAEFWSDLLKDRQSIPQDVPAGRELRTRKKVQYCDTSLLVEVDHGGEEDDSRRKRRRLSDGGQDISLCPEEEEVTNALDILAASVDNELVLNPSADVARVLIKTAPKEPMNSGKEEIPEIEGDTELSVAISSRNPTVDADAVRNSSVKEQDSVSVSKDSDSGVNVGKTEKQLLIQSMIVDLHKLCRALKLQDDVSKLAEQLLSFFVSKYKIPMSNKSLLYAVELSVCWLAAEQRHYCIDHGATLALAESHFGMPLAQVDSVYARIVKQHSEWKKNSGSDGAPLQSRVMERRQNIPLTRSVDAERALPQPQPQSKRQDATVVGLNHHSFMKQTSIDEALRRPPGHIQAHSSVNVPLENSPGDGFPVEQLPTEPLQHLIDGLVEQKMERMRMLLRRQKTEIGRLDFVKRFFLKDYTRNFKARAGLGLFERSVERIEALFDEKRKKLIEKQAMERNREKLLIASRFEKIHAGKVLDPLLDMEDGLEISDYIPSSSEISIAIQAVGLGSRISVQDISSMIETQKNLLGTSLPNEAPSSNARHNNNHGRVEGSRPQSPAFSQASQQSQKRALDTCSLNTRLGDSPLSQGQPSRPEAAMHTERPLVSAGLIQRPQMHLQNLTTTTLIGPEPNLLQNRQVHRDTRMSGSPGMPSSTISEGRGVASNSSMTNLPVVAREGVLGASVANSLPAAQRNPALSRLAQQYYHDPLAQEIVRIKKEQEKAKGLLDAEKERIKAQYMKELEALKKKYEDLLQKEDITFAKKCETIEAYGRRVELNRRLAEAFRIKAIDNPPTVNHGSSTQDANNLMVHNSSSNVNSIARALPLASGAIVSSNPSSQTMAAMAVSSVSGVGNPVWRSAAGLARAISTSATTVAATNAHSLPIHVRPQTHAAPQIAVVQGRLPPGIHIHGQNAELLGRASPSPAVRLSDEPLFNPSVVQDIAIQINPTTGSRSVTLTSPFNSNSGTAHELRLNPAPAFEEGQSVPNVGAQFLPRLSSLSWNVPPVNPLTQGLMPSFLDPVAASADAQSLHFASPSQSSHSLSGAHDNMLSSSYFTDLICLSDDD